jgi:dolichyl-phosphate-mannose-protein mannosyltransferase
LQPFARLRSGCYCCAVSPLRRHLPLILILALAAAIRLIIAPLGAHPGDLPIFMAWAAAMQEHGWQAVYTTSGANYPPLGMLLIDLSHRSHALLMPGAPVGGAGWMILFKLPSIVSDLLIIGLAARLRPTARWLWLSLALNPALIIMSAWWGQLDSIYVALLAAALAAAIARRSLWSGAAFGAALMVKQQSLFFTPVIAAALLAPLIGTLFPIRLREQYQTLRKLCSPTLHATLGAVLVTTPLMLPFVLTGQTVLMLKRLASIVRGQGWLTINALNFWYLVTGGSVNWGYNKPLVLSDTASLLGPLSYRHVGVALLGAWTLLVLLLAFRARAHSRVWLLAAAMIALGIFLWPTRAHERYPLAAVPLLALYSSAANTRAARRNELSAISHQPSAISHLPHFLLNSDALYVIISLGLTANLLWAAPPVRWLDPAAGQRGIGLIVAALMVSTALWGAALLARAGTFTGRGSQPDDAGSTTGKRSDAGPPGSAGGSSQPNQAPPPLRTR